MNTIRQRDLRTNNANSVEFETINAEFDRLRQYDIPPEVIEVIRDRVLIYASHNNVVTTSDNIFKKFITSLLVGFTNIKNLIKV